MVAKKTASSRNRKKTAKYRARLKAHRSRTKRLTTHARHRR